MGHKKNKPPISFSFYVVITVSFHPLGKHQTMTRESLLWHQTMSTQSMANLPLSKLAIKTGHPMLYTTHKLSPASVIEWLSVLWLWTRLYTVNWTVAIRIIPLLFTKFPFPLLLFDSMDQVFLLHLQRCLQSYVGHTFVKKTCRQGRAWTLLQSSMHRHSSCDDESSFIE